MDEGYKYEICNKHQEETFNYKKGKERMRKKEHIYIYMENLFSTCISLWVLRGT